MPLPESVPIRYTDEEAGYVTVRPVVRQTFRLDELLDMILSVTGKETARIRQILRSGTVVYHFYRYWWTGFETDETELAMALERFPSSDISRTFSADLCTLAVFDSCVMNAKPLIELTRAAASDRRIFRSQSFWERLLEIAAEQKPVYLKYSYAHKADIYLMDLNDPLRGRITDAANRLAGRNLRSSLNVLSSATRILLYCPRQ